MAPVPLGQPGAEAPGAGELFGVARRVVGDFDQRLVAQHPVAGHVEALAFGFAPRRDFAQHGKSLSVGGSDLDAAEGLAGLAVIGGGTGQHRHFLLEPAFAAVGVEFPGQFLIGRAQVGDVGHGVFDLAFAQRPERPVSKARALVDAGVGELGDQGLVADRVAKAADHGRDLGIEHRRRQPPGLMVENFQVLTGGVEDLEHVFVGQNFIQRSQVDAVGERVDAAGLVGPGHLHQAQDRPIGRLAHEFSIDGDVIGRSKAGAEIGQRLGVGDHRHGRQV